MNTCFVSEKLISASCHPQTLIFSFFFGITVGHGFILVRGAASPPGLEPRSTGPEPVMLPIAPWRNGVRVRRRPTAFPLSPKIARTLSGVDGCCISRAESRAKVPNVSAEGIEPPTSRRKRLYRPLQPANICLAPITNLWSDSNRHFRVPLHWATEIGVHNRSQRYESIARGEGRSRTDLITLCRRTAIRSRTSPFIYCVPQQ